MDSFGWATKPSSKVVIRWYFFCFVNLVPQNCSPQKKYFGKKYHTWKKYHFINISFCLCSLGYHSKPNLNEVIKFLRTWKNISIFIQILCFYIQKHIDSSDKSYQSSWKNIRKICCWPTLVVDCCFVCGHSGIIGWLLGCLYDSLVVVLVDV